jgi:hypothetical protein
MPKGNKIPEIEEGQTTQSTSTFFFYTVSDMIDIPKI